MIDSIEVKGSKIVDWVYPEIYNNPDYLEISLIHTRASDGIRVKYESERDGFVIEQPMWKDGLEVEWAEVYFAKSWKFEGE